MIRRTLTISGIAAALAGGSLSAQPVISGLTTDPGTKLAGHVLLSELNSTACHAGEISAKGAPNLDGAGSRIRRGYLEAFIADPQGTKPGTTMPNVMAALSKEERADKAAALADYLESLASAPFKADAVNADASERGRELYHQVGCVACHDPEDKTLAGSSPLHRLDEKYGVAGLTAFLEDPLAVRPGGRMPDMRLTHWEAVDIASYLLRDQKEVPPAAPSVGRAEEGKALFQNLGCVQCHQPADAKKDFAKSLETLDLARNCVSADFGLSETQLSQIAGAFVGASTVDPVRLTLTQLNCIACHKRDGYGGPSDEHDAYFTTSNLNLGDQARIPPLLTGVGAKLKPEWLSKVLLLGESVRPYMHTRMPKFGPANVEHLVELFGETDHLQEVKIDRVRDEKVAREAGQSLVGVKNLACVACHMFNGESATTLAGLEMTSMTARLQENWFHQYLVAPQSFQPTTIMPSFWPGGKATRPEVLDGNSSQQIDAIWQYLSRGREARMPEGIRREPIEYGPAGDEAVMLRRQYNGIGKRGIGVGYPSGVNLAFDAGQMRLGSVWPGPLGEMSGVWLGQGSGNVNERSRDVVRFPAGPAFARLESPDASWPAFEPSEIGEKIPGLQFLGYTLDKKQRPTFRYRFEELTVSDEFVDSEGALTRTIRFDKPAPPGLCFRVRDETTDLKNLRISPDAPFLPLAGKTEITIDYRFESK